MIRALLLHPPPVHPAPDSVIGHNGGGAEGATIRKVLFGVEDAVWRHVEGSLWGGNDPNAQEHDSRLSGTQLHNSVTVTAQHPISNSVQYRRHGNKGALNSQLLQINNREKKRRNHIL